jgi:Domain of unknown function (DUF4331)
VFNHFSAAYLKFPGDDARLDLTDPYVFAAAGDLGKTLLIIAVNPFTAGLSATPPFLMKPGFHPRAAYRINIDNDGDSQADLAFSVDFANAPQGQTGTVRCGVGALACEPGTPGDVLLSGLTVGFGPAARPVWADQIRLFAGVRSDPFFADAEGALHGFVWTGQDTFAGRNVQCIALEVSDELLGTQPEIGVWATVSVRRDGALVQVDRGAHPTINPFINPDYAKDEYEAGESGGDVAKYLQPWSRLLQEHGYPAVAAARTVMPDILRYDRCRLAAYPNGRALTGDAFSARMAFLSYRKAAGGGLLPEFPYLGPPVPYGSA